MDTIVEAFDDMLGEVSSPYVQTEGKAFGLIIRKQRKSHVYLDHVMYVLARFHKGNWLG